MKQRIPHLFFAALAGAVLFSCGEQGLRSGDEVTTVDVDSTKSNLVNVSGKLFSIPSPVQTALLIRNADVPFNRDDLSNLDNFGDYVSKASQAMNLGVYGTDMAYSSLYDDGQSALRFYKGVDKLSRLLGILGAIDQNLVQRLGANVGNADSLLLLSGKFYSEADQYLKENERYDIAAYVLIGGWAEATHLTAIAAAGGTKASRDRLAEQGQTVKTLIDVLEDTAEDEFKSGEVMELLRELSLAYNSVEKQYEYVEPVTNTQKKTTSIKSVSKYQMSDETFELIKERVAKLRNIITG
ncbi:MAG: hypothetical protein ABR572_03125 [Cryomorphaceae bacterium]